ncbi:DUF4395 domain-containing protein [Dermacoccaceae bacterium W4C1]
MRSYFTFPNPVNDKAARTVATGVVLMSALFLITGWTWVLAVLAYGFVARVLAGPRLSPLGALAMKVIAPRLGEPVLTPGPPKRFAQAIGASFSVAALISNALGAHLLAVALIAVLTVFATLEAALGFCAGCYVFGHLMRWGLIPEDTCEACADIARRRSASASATPRMAFQEAVDLGVIDTGEHTRGHGRQQV